jgi:putative membrane protein
VDSPEIKKIDRQREHQANERTFLAWLRTSIALIGFGFAIARFGLFLRELQSTVTANPGTVTTPASFLRSQTVGIGLVVVGITIIIFAVWRYNQVFWQIERAAYRPSRLLVWVTAGVVLVLGVLSIPLVLWRPLPPAAPSSSTSRRMNTVSPPSSLPLVRSFLELAVKHSDRNQLN